MYKYISRLFTEDHETRGPAGLDEHLSTLYYHCMDLDSGLCTHLLRHCLYPQEIEVGFRKWYLAFGFINDGARWYWNITNQKELGTTMFLFLFHPWFLYFKIQLQRSPIFMPNNSSCSQAHRYVRILRARERDIYLPFHNRHTHRAYWKFIWHRNKFKGRYGPNKGTFHDCRHACGQILQYTRRL